MVDKCEEMCCLVSSLGPQQDVEAQDLMARLTLDIILRAGFGMCASYMSDLQPVPLLQELHYAMDESFRSLTSSSLALVMPLSGLRAARGQPPNHFCGRNTEGALWLPLKHPGECKGLRKSSSVALCAQGAHICLSSCMLSGHSASRRVPSC